MGECLGHLPRLQVLRLACVELGSRGATALAEGLLEAAEAALPGRSGSTSAVGGGGGADLRVLDLEGNDIGDSGAEDLADALRVLPALQVLKLMGNRPAFEGTQALVTAAALLPALQARTPLRLWPCLTRTLVLSQCPCRRLHALDAAQHEDLATPCPACLPRIAGGSGQGLHQRVGVQQLTEGCVVQVFTLGDSGGVSPQGAPMIRKPVVAAGLTWEGAVLLMTKLQHMHGLRELRLPGLGAPLVTGFMEGVVARLADALRTLPALQLLDVRGLGQLSAAAAATLAASIAASPSLELVDFSGSSVGPAAIDMLRAQGRRGRTHVLLTGAS